MGVRETDEPHLSWHHQRLCPDNYRMEFSRDSIFFRWNTPVAQNDPTPRSNFSIDVDGGQYTVSVSRKKGTTSKHWGDVIVTDSVVAVVAFLNAYKDYCIEQKFFEYRY